MVNMKKMLSNGLYASEIKDFEEVMDYNDFQALNDIINYENPDQTNWERAYREEELHSDALYQRNMNAWSQADEIINYLLEAKRMNKAKLLDMLRELQNDLENY